MSFFSTLRGAIFVLVITEIHTEDLHYCPSTEVFGGILVRLYYASVSDFAKIVLPEAEGYEDSRIISKGNILLKHGKSLKAVDVYLDQGSLSEKVTGSVKRWKQMSELSFQLTGMTPRNLGFLSQMGNSGLVFFVSDSNGRVWVLGNLRNAAYLTSGDATSGKKFEEDNMVSFTFSANTGLYEYAGNIAEIGEEAEKKQVGGFSKGFSKGFRI